MLLLFKKIIENANARRARRIQDNFTRNQDTNVLIFILILIEKFEKGAAVKTLTYQQPFATEEITHSIKQRIQSMRKNIPPFNEDNPIENNQPKLNETDYVTCKNSGKIYENLSNSNIDNQNTDNTTPIKGSIKRKAVAQEENDFNLEKIQVDKKEIQNIETKSPKISKLLNSTIPTYPHLPDESGSTITSSMCENSMRSFVDSFHDDLNTECSLKEELVVTPVKDIENKGLILYPSTPNTPKVLVCEDPNIYINKNRECNLDKLGKRLDTNMSVTFTAYNNQQVNSWACDDNSISIGSRMSASKKANSHASIASIDYCLIHNHDHYRYSYNEIKRSIAENQTIIIQTSQALNMAYSQSKSKRLITPEMIEAERLLLLATQKRTYYRDYEEKLLNRDLKCVCEPSHIFHYRVNLIVKDLSLFIKNDYFYKYTKDNGIFYFCFIISHKHHIFSTNVISIHDVEENSVHFKNVFKFYDIDVTDSIRIQLYAFTHNQQISNSMTKFKKFKLPKIELTPRTVKFLRKFSAVDSSSCENITTASRSSSFSYVGEINFLADLCGTQKLTLPNIVFDCPITGVFSLNIECHLIDNCHAKGFLTVNKCSAKTNIWQRYWVGLYKDNLSLWQYPADEQIKDPVGKIVLKWADKEQSIRLLQYDECARPNTFEIKLIEVDHTQLKSINNVTRYYLCADSKEERTKWMESLKVHLEKYMHSRTISMSYL
ncbi:hypothetical protein HZS_1809 [Henneguya salminicola]|nr:hypothetical protein HZS_1809 [Henneguya salminicola]